MQNWTESRTPVAASQPLISAMLVFSAGALSVLLILLGQGLVAVGLTFGLIAALALSLDSLLPLVLGTALFSAFVPNTVDGFLHPEEFQSLWTLRPVRGVSIVDLAFLALGVRFILARAQRRAKPRSLPLDRPVLYLGFLVAFGGFLGLMHRDEHQQWPYWFWSVRIFLYFFFFYYVCSRVPTSFQVVKRLTGIIVAVTVARWIYTSANSLFFNPTGFLSVSGTEAIFFNETAGLLIPAAVILAVLLLWPGYSLKRRSALGTLLLGILVSLAISGRRTCLLMIVMGLAVYPLTARSKLALGRFLALGLLFVLVLSATVSVSPAVHEIGVYLVESLQDPEQGIGERTSEVQNVLGNLDTYGGWIYGLGLGRAWRVFAWNPEFASYSAFSDENGRGTHWLFTVHVPMLDLLLFFGAGGALLYLFLWLWTGKVMRDQVSGLPPGEPRFLAQALFCAILSLLPVMTLQTHLVVLNGALLGISAALLGATRVANKVLQAGSSATAEPSRSKPSQERAIPFVQVARQD